MLQSAPSRKNSVWAALGVAHLWSSVHGPELVRYRHAAVDIGPDDVSSTQGTRLDQLAALCLTRDDSIIFCLHWCCGWLLHWNMSAPSSALCSLMILPYVLSPEEQ